MRRFLNRKHKQKILEKVMKVTRKQPTFDVVKFDGDLKMIAGELNVDVRTEYSPTEDKERFSVHNPKTNQWVTVHDGWFVVKEDDDLKFYFGEDELAKDYEVAHNE